MLYSRILSTETKKGARITMGLGVRATHVSLVALLVAGLLVTAARPDAPQQVCFANGFGFCVEGPFLAFWQRHGGLRVFGYPVTAPADERTASGVFRVQYFERVRMELHPENRAPYDVLLGRIGVERLRALGRGGETLPQAPLGKDCTYFAATGHNVCRPFIAYWKTHGLRLMDGDRVTAEESIGLLGLPITEARPETGPAGQQMLVQWFERARIVRFPDGSVTAITLGSEVARSKTSPPPPENDAGAPADEIPLAPSPGPEPAGQIETSPAPEPAQAPTANPPPPASTPAPPPSTPTPTPPPPASSPPPPVSAGVPSAPPPAPPCDLNVPTPAEGLQLWVTNPRPSSEEDQATACIRLIVGGDPAKGANGVVYRYYSEETRTSIPQSTGADGVASFIFYIGPGSPGMPTHIEAVASYGGVTYRATTWLTGQ